EREGGGEQSAAKPYLRARVASFRKIDWGDKVVLPAPAVIMLSGAFSYSSEVESESDKAGFKERPRHHKHNLVVHGPAIERVGMANDRGPSYRPGRFLNEGLDPALRPVQKCVTG